MRYAIIIPLSGLLLILAGCSRDDAGNEQSANTAIVDNVTVPDEMEGGGPAVSDNAAKPEGPDTNAQSTMIPPAMRGRWGLVPADCTSTHGDAKGLLEITAADLLFYESRGHLTVLKEREPTRIVGQFAFSGEGMTWQRDMLLALEDDKNTLIRRDLGKDAEPGLLRYRRCAD